MKQAPVILLQIPVVLNIHFSAAAFSLTFEAVGNQEVFLHHSQHGKINPAFVSRKRPFFNGWLFLFREYGKPS